MKGNQQGSGAPPVSYTVRTEGGMVHRVSHEEMQQLVRSRIQRAKSSAAAGLMNRQKMRNPISPARTSLSAKLQEGNAPSSLDTKHRASPEANGTPPSSSPSKMKQRNPPPSPERTGFHPRTIPVLFGRKEGTGQRNVDAAESGEDASTQRDDEISVKTEADGVKKMSQVEMSEYLRLKIQSARLKNAMRERRQTPIEVGSPRRPIVVPDPTIESEEAKTKFDESVNHTTDGKMSWSSMETNSHSSDSVASTKSSTKLDGESSQSCGPSQEEVDQDDGSLFSGFFQQPPPPAPSPQPSEKQSNQQSPHANVRLTPKSETPRSVGNTRTASRERQRGGGSPVAGTQATKEPTVQRQKPAPSYHSRVAFQSPIAVSPKSATSERSHDNTMDATHEVATMVDVGHPKKQAHDSSPNGREKAALTSQTEERIKTKASMLRKSLEQKNREIGKFLQKTKKHNNQIAQTRPTPRSGRRALSSAEIDSYVQDSGRRAKETAANAISSLVTETVQKARQSAQEEIRAMVKESIARAKNKSAIALSPRSFARNEMKTRQVTETSDGDNRIQSEQQPSVASDPNPKIGTNKNREGEDVECVEGKSEPQSDNATDPCQTERNERKSTVGRKAIHEPVKSDEQRLEEDDQTSGEQQEHQSLMEQNQEAVSGELRKESMPAEQLNESVSDEGHEEPRLNEQHKQTIPAEQNDKELTSDEQDQKEPTSVNKQHTEPMLDEQQHNLQTEPTSDTQQHKEPTPDEQEKHIEQMSDEPQRIAPLSDETQKERISIENKKRNTTHDRCETSTEQQETPLDLAQSETAGLKYCPPNAGGGETYEAPKEIRPMRPRKGERPHTTKEGNSYRKKRFFSHASPAFREGAKEFFKVPEENQRDGRVNSVEPTRPDLGSPKSRPAWLRLRTVSLTQNDESALEVDPTESHAPPPFPVHEQDLPELKLLSRGDMDAVDTKSNDIVAKDGHEDRDGENESSPHSPMDENSEMAPTTVPYPDEKKQIDNAATIEQRRKKQKRKASRMARNRRLELGSQVVPAGASAADKETKTQLETPSESVTPHSAGDAFMSSNTLDEDIGSSEKNEEAVEHNQISTQPSGKGNEPSPSPEPPRESDSFQQEEQEPSVCLDDEPQTSSVGLTYRGGLLVLSNLLPPDTAQISTRPEEHVPSTSTEAPIPTLTTNRDPPESPSVSVPEHQEEPGSPSNQEYRDEQANEQDLHQSQAEPVRTANQLDTARVVNGMKGDSALDEEIEIVALASVSSSESSTEDANRDPPATAESYDSGSISSVSHSMGSGSSLSGDTHSVSFINVGEHQQKDSTQAYVNISSVSDHDTTLDEKESSSISKRETFESIGSSAVGVTMKKKRMPQKYSRRRPKQNRAQQGVAAGSVDSDDHHWLLDRITKGFDALVDHAESGSDLETIQQQREKEIQQLGSFAFSHGMMSEMGSGSLVGSGSLASYEEEEDQTVTVAVENDDACHIM